MVWLLIGEKNKNSALFIFLSNIKIILFIKNLSIKIYNIITIEKNVIKDPMDDTKFHIYIESKKSE